MKSVVKATAIAVMFLPAIACQTVKMPKIDLIKLPEFRDALESPSDYPDVALSLIHISEPTRPY